MSLPNHVLDHGTVLHLKTVWQHVCVAMPQVEVQHEVDGWLQVANIHGEVGLVPSSFVRILQPGEASPAAVGAAGAALSSAVSTGFDGMPGIVTNPYCILSLSSLLLPHFKP